MPSSALARNRIAGGVFATAVLLMAVLANLPYRYVEREGVWHGLQRGSEDWMNDSGRLQPTMAGWPMRYWIRYELGDRPGSADRYWSVSRLAVNVMLGLGAAGLVYGFTLLRRRRIDSANNTQMTRALFDMIIALGIVLSPTTLFLLNYQKTKSQRELVRRVVPGGSVYLSCELPEPIAERVPSAWVSALMRIRLVLLNQPENQLVETVVQIPSLRGLWLGGDRYDFVKLKPLRGRVHLACLQINRRELSDEDVRTIAQCRWLKQLSLAQTNMDARLLRGLDQLVGLHWVDLTRTPLKLSELGKPAWSDTVRTLSLSRPQAGSGSTLTIDGWPELKKLSVTRWSLSLNPATLELRLSNLPKLESLLLNRFQCHALIGRNLPRLFGIFENDESMILALRERDRGVPGLTWFSELQLDGIASLKRLECYAADLRSISIRNAPNLVKLEMGTFSIFGDGHATISQPRVDVVQSWIDSLGQSDGPRIVELNALPLHGVDLSPLVNNARLQELGLSHTDVSYDQLRGLEGLTHLTRLELDGCRLRDDQLSWLFQQFPNLKKLSADVSEVKDFDLAAAPNLDLVNLTPFGNIRQFRLVDRPRLGSWFCLDRAPDRLEIRNAQSLGGLEVRQPWPQDSSIRGLRDLQWFIAGGTEIDDRVVDALLQCRSLNRLTLAYPSVSAEKLCEIGQLKALSSIELPGAAVDDSVTENWHQIKLLHHLNLDDTAVSAGTFSWLSRIDSLRSLSINRVTLDQSASHALGFLVQLDRLGIADTAVPNESLVRILDEGVIEQLDLSGNAIDSELIGALADCASLRHLKLHRCNIAEENLVRLLSSNRVLLIDLGGDLGNFDPQIRETLQTRYRSQPDYQRHQRFAAVSSYPKFELNLELGDFVVFGTTPVIRSAPFDLNAFRNIR